MSGATQSLASRVALLGPEQRAAVLADLTGDNLNRLTFDWKFWARPDQIAPPPPWRTWLLLGGRGSGKTRSSAEWVRDEVENGRRRSIGIIGPTADTLRRDVVQGPSGLIEISPPWCKPVHEPSQRRVIWPNGAVAHLLSSEEPNRIRGPNLDGFWGDELTSWANAEDCWDNLQFALRISGPKGDAPAGVVSTTPKRHALLKTVLADPDTVVTRSRTFDNAANLDPRTLAYLQRRYGGTSIGRQELDAELLEDVDGALWNRTMLDSCRTDFVPDLRRLVVAIDPAGGAHRKSDETGIVAAGVGYGDRAFVLADASGKYSPDGWARTAVGLYHALHADLIVAESNFGGSMVESTIRTVDPNVPIRLVHASRGKAVRAEPVVSMYEQGRVHHVGLFPTLEDQLCGWDPNVNGPSPDRLDALVWAITDLMLNKSISYAFGSL